ncbi:MAG: chemotaxis protein [Spirochaetes bacterium]|nr:MAG: chemotaxis protein [Spirochaetota bacterium]
MSDIVITGEDFLKFREFFYRKTGILFSESKRYFVDKRLSERITASGHTDFRGYFNFMRFQASGEELQRLTNIMTVNETYFFREEYQFQSLVESMLPEITARKKEKKTIKIWSIPSSSGEEPYSIALYLLEYWKGIEQWDVELYASDIDTEMIRKAKKGVYSKRSVQHLPKNILHKYFSKLSDGTFGISEEIIRSVEFTRVNLNDPASTRPYRNFDIIFCRNLLIYFDDISRRRSAEVFYGALNPGGYICLGHSESMSRISSLFKIRKFPKSIVYQKPEVGYAK